MLVNTLTGLNPEWECVKVLVKISEGVIKNIPYIYIENKMNTNYIQM